MKTEHLHPLPTSTITAWICWIESTQLGLTITRVVLAAVPRDVVLVAIRNSPFPTTPDRPARLLVYSCSIVQLSLPTAWISWIESTEFLLTISRVVLPSIPRDVVLVAIRNSPLTVTPDRPATLELETFCLNAVSAPSDHLMLKKERGPRIPTD